MGSRDHSITCTTCGMQRGGLNAYECACDRPIPRHKARIEPWPLDELKARLGTLVDGLSSTNVLPVSPLDVALELLAGELEAFVLFGRMGHLDPPREDGKVPIVVLQCKSAAPEVDAMLRDTAKRWVSDQEHHL